MDKNHELNLLLSPFRRISSPRQKLGFGYDELIKANPGIIMFSASMLEAAGPHAAQPGLGQELASLAEFDNLTGWPDHDPVSARGPYTDVVACRIGGATLFAALDYQRRTGQGGYIDLSQFKASLHFLAPLILEYQAAGKLLSRMGNRSPAASPRSRSCQLLKAPLRKKQTR